MHCNEDELGNNRSLEIRGHDSSDPEGPSELSGFKIRFPATPKIFRKQGKKVTNHNPALTIVLGQYYHAEPIRMDAECSGNDPKYQ